MAFLGIQVQAFLDIAVSQAFQELVATLEYQAILVGLDILVVAYLAILDSQELTAQMEQADLVAIQEAMEQMAQVVFQDIAE